MTEIKKIKPSLPKGTRDFLPNEVYKRNFIFSVIKNKLQLFGFQPIETPAFERIETLTGKYGEEGDRLLFKILNSGDFLKDVPDNYLQEKNSLKTTAYLVEKGLRYDLTVPLARFAVQHQEEIAFPFKRYHVGSVWRADRPQKGRYQEFYQFDADVIGSRSLLLETELTQIFQEVFDELKIAVSIRINNRKILEGIAEYASCADKITNMTIAIDKMDKIGMDGVKKELLERNFSETQIEKIESLLSVKDLQELKSKTAEIKIAQQGIIELQEVFEKSKSTALEFDCTLARGLNYYTGVIWEIKPLQSAIGSIGSGGRYDNLTELFGGREMSGVGISFGIERIYDIMQEQNLFPTDINKSTKILITYFDEKGMKPAWELVNQLRKKNISSEIYPEQTKFAKQMKYANDKGIPYVIIIGDDEIAASIFTLKNMLSGEQVKLNAQQIIDKFLS